MKKIGCVLLALCMGLAACGSDDYRSEPEAGTVVKATPEASTEEEVKRTSSEPEESAARSQDPEEVEEDDPLSSMAAYSSDEALLNDVRRQVECGEAHLEQLWWVNDSVVAELFGEEVFPDGSYHNGIFLFEFSHRGDIAQLAEESGFSAEKLENTWTNAWPWARWDLLCRRWSLYATVQPMKDGWPTPRNWIPPEDRTYEETKNAVARWHEDSETQVPADNGPESPQPTSEYVMPEFVPVEDHPGYELAVVEEAEDGRALQVRLRWTNEEGFGFWAELPGYALEIFWEHEGEWFIPVEV